CRPRSPCRPTTRTWASRPSSTSSSGGTPAASPRSPTSDPGGVGMSAVTHLGGVGAWIALTLVAGGCAAQVAPSTRTGVRPPTAVLVDADPDGAIVLDRHDQYVGMNRDGTVAWREPAGAHAYT